MSDITKCINESCPMRKTCYRHTAKDGFLQSYARFEYTNDEEVSCDYYWPKK